MSDLSCALVDATGTVSNVIVCCGGNPATCSLKPTRITAAMGAVGPGYTSNASGGFDAPPLPTPPPLAVVSATAAGTTATVTVTK